MASKKTTLPVLNLETATFECTYGRGCEGICCQNGRPPVSEKEKERIDANLEKFLPHLSEEARKEIEKGGYLSRRLKAGKPMLRVVDGWCVFFNAGCVLHKVGMAEGDKFRYKPAPCSLFPLEHDDGQWYVRQHGYKGEQWDLFCLAPGQSSVPAAVSLKEELALARRRMEQEGPA
jgi:Fe-S-cluster containining protein